MSKIEHKFYIGDASQVLSNIADNSIQLIVTSPPYWNARNYKYPQQLGFGQTYEKYLEAMEQVFEECVRVLLHDGKFALNIGNIYYKDKIEKRSYTINLVMDLWKILNEFMSLKYMGTIFWKKTTSRNGAVLFGSYPFPSNFMISTALESIHVFRKMGKRNVTKEVKERSRISKVEFRDIREPIWYLNGVSKKVHPAVFPNKLPHRLIKMYSFYGDTILDPFCGIGTTNIEALKLGRSSIGIDIREDYIKMAVSNLKEVKKSASILVFNYGEDIYE